MKNVTFKLRLLICILFFLNLIAGCKKEQIQPSETLNPVLAKYASEDGAQWNLYADKKETETQPEKTEDLNRSKPEYPYASGKCKLIFRVGGYDPNLIHGGSNPPCSNSSIYFKAYSQPDGQGTLLYSATMPITGGWQTWAIPSSGYIQFIILQDLAEQERDGPCRFKFNIAEYGWNRPVLEWVNIPYGQWLPVIAGRFAPKDPSTDGGYNFYEEYLCESWCTWTLPIWFTWNEPPSNPFLTASIKCIYDNGGGFPNQYDPRLLKDHFIYDNSSQTKYMYPISMDDNELYRTRAKSLSTSEETIHYEILGENGQGIGPFSWGLAPYNAQTSGGDCNILPVR